MIFNYDTYDKIYGKIISRNEKLIYQAFSAQPYSLCQWIRETSGDSL